MKVLVFGGTTEGRLLARELSALGAQVTVSVAPRWERRSFGAFRR